MGVAPEGGTSTFPWGCKVPLLALANGTLSVMVLTMGPIRPEWNLVGSGFRVMPPAPVSTNARGYVSNFMAEPSGDPKAFLTASIHCLPTEYL